MTIPTAKGLTKRTIIPPKDGWKQKTYYIIECAFSKTNVIHKSILYSGFLHNGEPSGYSFIISAGYENIKSFHEAFYIKVLSSFSLEYRADDIVSGINKEIKNGN